jgi:hypothetical protein
MEEARITRDLPEDLSKNSASKGSRRQERLLQENDGAGNPVLPSFILLFADSIHC